MNRQSQGYSGTSDWLLSALKQNPEGLLLLAAGAALLMRTGRLGSAATAGGRRVGQAAAEASDAVAAGGARFADTAASGGARFAQAASGAKDYAADVAGRTMDKAGEFASSAAGRTMNKAGEFASSASAMAGDARRAVGRQSERFVEQAQSTFQSTMDRILKDQPLFVAVAGMAAGAALAAAFPATDFEKQNLGPIGDQVSDAAERIGEQLKEATAKAGETLKSAAQGRGLDAEGLKDVASEVADAFTASMSGGVDQKTGASSQRTGSTAQSGMATPSGSSGRSG
jgi:hypothetical protein